MNKQEIGKKLKALRIEKNMTQVELSKELGIPQPTIASYETGVRMPMDETKVQLAKFFGVSIADLFYAETLA